MFRGARAAEVAIGGAPHRGQIGVTAVIPFTRQITAALLALFLTVGCASDPEGVAQSRGAGDVAATSLADAVQLAQAEDDLDDEDFEDDGFEDLFPGEDPLALEEDYDPFETVNRFVFAFNEALDFFIIRPLAELYGFLLPEVVRDSVRNVVRNLLEPVNFLNHLWQGKDDDAADIAARFLINSTIGLGGLIDVAGYWGIPYRTEDFGQTLGFYGAEPGPYIVLPLLGPSSLRDTIGRGVDALIDPWGYVVPLVGIDPLHFSAARLTAYGIDLRQRNLETIDELRRDSVDFYARVRSLYLQRRRAEIADEDKEQAARKELRRDQTAKRVHIDFEARGLDER